MAICEFCILIDDTYKKCDREASNVARMSDLCSTHFRFLVRDNKKRIEKEIDIPNDFSTVINIMPYQWKSCVIEIKTPIKKEECTYVE